jgi:hypothetical protein
MDNRLTPKWDTSLTRKRRKYKVIKTEDFERYQRIIAHYDEELNAANSCIRDIYSFCEMIEKSHAKHNIDFIKDVKNKIKKYYVETDNYSEENVKCLIEGREIEAEDIQMNNEAKMVTVSSMEDYV